MRYPDGGGLDAAERARREQRFTAAGYVLVGIGWTVTGAIGTTDWVHVGIGIAWMISGVCWWLAMRRTSARGLDAAGEGAPGRGGEREVLPAGVLAVADQECAVISSSRRRARS